MNISTNFDSGSIRVVNDADVMNIQLEIAKDNNACTQQWFHFHLQTQANINHKIRIINAGKCTFATGFDDYQVIASYDQETWFRVPTVYLGNELHIEHAPNESGIYYAYFVPYSSARHQQLISSSQMADICNVKSLGFTSHKQSIDLFKIGVDKNGKKKKVWVIARQHPGETMAQWFAEGLIKKLLDNSPMSHTLLESAIFYIVPNMNPDGSILGNHRTNSNGKNLNRQWHEPAQVESTEVFHVQQAMKESGVDLFIDVHGDEEIPYSFMMASGASNSTKESLNSFKNNFEKASPNFQSKYDYDTHKETFGTRCCGSTCTGKSTFSKATDYVEHHHKCLSLLLEMPFKELDNTRGALEFNPHHKFIEMGKAAIVPILAHIKE